MQPRQKFKRKLLETKAQGNISYKKTQYERELIKEEVGAISSWSGILELIKLLKQFERECLYVKKNNSEIALGETFKFHFEKTTKILRLLGENYKKYSETYPIRRIKVNTQKNSNFDIIWDKLKYILSKSSSLPTLINLFDDYYAWIELKELISSFFSQVKVALNYELLLTDVDLTQASTKNTLLKLRKKITYLRTTIKKIYSKCKDQRSSGNDSPLYSSLKSPLLKIRVKLGRAFETINKLVKLHFFVV